MLKNKTKNIIKYKQAKIIENLTKEVSDLSTNLLKITGAVKKCYNICEECGAPGKRERRDGWMKVLRINCEKDN